MKKIIALALALIMALSMGSVAFAAYTVDADITVDYPAANVATFIDQDLAPGAKVALFENKDAAFKKEWSKISYNFTSSKYGFEGASLIESVEWVKDAKASTPEAKVYDLVVTMKENLTATTDKDFAGMITVTGKTKQTDGTYLKYDILFQGIVGNEIAYVEGAKKVANAEELVIGTDMKKDTVIFAEDASGYVSFVNGALSGTVALVKDEKAQVYFADYKTEVAEETQDAIEAFLGDDFDGIVEYIVFEGTGFKNAVDFQYDAYEEDPHFFYAWDGEKFVDLEAKYDADEDVDNYVFTADAKGIILVSDVELVAAAEEETKNPDTGANDVVGVAAALAVVSLVAAGAVSLKK